MLKHIVMSLLLLTAFAAAPAFAKADEDPRIQIAILLDTSSSMDGLIAQTKEQLWQIVNTFATAKRDGKKPRLEIALYQYGNDSLSSEAGFIQQLSPLTTNLDLISEKLFALRTNGGNEYCGQVIQKAIDQLSWSDSKKDLKLIYIAGNEPFNQGPVDFRKAVSKAIAKGVVVNTLHCGDEATGASTGWKEAAMLADGNFITIDQNRAVVRIDAPQDQELVRLNAALNKTYIGYGRGGAEGMERQRAQDGNAAAMAPSAMATRAVSKSTGFYDNSGWDLVDAKKKGAVKLEAMAKDDLPAEMRELKPEERKAFVDGKEKERAKIVEQIKALSQERDAFVTTETKKRAAAGAATSGGALIQSAKTQAEKNAFTF
ncbi:MAG: VWA domain-containing protein [Myxococcaceae bacterium]|nr:VWA domain-containing protein [Myxococcaceae bacterium]